MSITIGEGDTDFIPTSTKVRFSGHHLKWSWFYTGITNRVPEKKIAYRGWYKLIYRFKSKTIVLNYSPKKENNIMEVWLRSKPYKNVAKLIYSNWSKADLIAREFSEFAQIGIKPIHTPHPADIDKAHLVATTKEYNPILKPMSEIKDNVGLLFDKSHKEYPEVTGPKSAEGALGAEWFFTKFPLEHRVILQALVGFEEYNRNIKLHLEVLREIKEALKRLDK
jgi:hypothetical protein